MENRFLKRTIGRQSSKIAEQYGDIVGILKAVSDICKHVSIGSNEGQEEKTEWELRIKWKSRSQLQLSQPR